MNNLRVTCQKVKYWNLFYVTFSLKPTADRYKREIEIEETGKETQRQIISRSGKYIKKQKEQLGMIVINSKWIFQCRKTLWVGPLHKIIRNNNL